MTEDSAANAAERIWERSAAAAADADAAAERLGTELHTGLKRWIGTDGYRMVLDRALRSVRTGHPALGDLSCFREDVPMTTAPQTHSAAEIAAGMVALVTALIELLGRIIGKEMALRLVEQIGTPSPREVISTETEGERDG